MATGRGARLSLLDGVQQMVRTLAVLLTFPDFLTPAARP